MLCDMTSRLMASPSEGRSQDACQPISSAAERDVEEVKKGSIWNVWGEKTPTYSASSFFPLQYYWPRGAFVAWAAARGGGVAWGNRMGLRSRPLSPSRPLIGLLTVCEGHILSHRGSSVPAEGITKHKYIYTPYLQSKREVGGNDQLLVSVQLFLANLHDGFTAQRDNFQTAQLKVKLQMASAAGTISLARSF